MTDTEQLVGQVVKAERLDGTELQLSYDDGRIVRLYAEDSVGFWANLFAYVPDSLWQPTVADVNRSETGARSRTN